MSIAEQVEASLADIKPMLDAAGRAIAVTEASDDACTIELKGFCGDCACSSTYMEGIQEMLQAKMPGLKQINFVQS